jgi:hypothetical protein
MVIDFQVPHTGVNGWRAGGFHDDSGRASL